MAHEGGQAGRWDVPILPPAPALSLGRRPGTGAQAFQMLDDETVPQARCAVQRRPPHVIDGINVDTQFHRDLDCLKSQGFLLDRVARLTIRIPSASRHPHRRH